MSSALLVASAMLCMLSFLPLFTLVMCLITIVSTICMFLTLEDFIEMDKDLVNFFKACCLLVILSYCCRVHSTKYDGQ